MALFNECNYLFMLGLQLKHVSITHWGRVTHICVGNLTIIGSDNGLSPGRCQAIIWTNAGILLIGPLGTNFSEIFIEIHTFSFKKMHLKMSSSKWRPFCLGLNVLRGLVCGVSFCGMPCYSVWGTCAVMYLNIYGSAILAWGLSLPAGRGKCSHKLNTSQLKNGAWFDWFSNIMV